MQAQKVQRLLRKLASQTDNQTIFSKAKEYNFDLFENKIDFSPIQIEYLSFSTFYQNLLMDIAMGEVDEDILGDYIYEDSYMYYKTKSKGKEEKYPHMNRNMNQKFMKNRPEKHSSKRTSQWIFKRPKRK